MRDIQKKEHPFLAEPNFDNHMTKMRKSKRLVGYANCWHSSRYESDAMWQKYLTTETVALVSNRAGMRQGLKTEREVHLGRIKYKNYLPGTMDYVDDRNLFGPLLTKRNNFEYEKEVRAIILDSSDTNDPDTGAGHTRDYWSLNPSGISVGVDLNLLLKEVRIHPGSGEGFLKTVQNISIQYGLKVEIKDSEMNAEPIF